MTNTQAAVNYNHPKRPPLGTRPVIVLAAGESVRLTAAGAVLVPGHTSRKTINYRKGA